MQMNDRRKDLIAYICIVMALLALILGCLFPKPIGNSFSVGTVFGTIAFLLSMGSVKDTGSNIPAKIAFGLSFAGMTAAILVSSRYVL